MKTHGRVIWITGLSGAGKSTLAKALLPHLQGCAVLLDGDELRAVLGATTTQYDSESRLALALTYARMAKLLADQGITVVVATISLFHAVHAWNREHLPNYLEVYLDVPREECYKRDPKGLYSKAAQGLVDNMVGAGVLTEIPQAPHLRLFPTHSLDASVQKILEQLSCV